MTRVDDLQPHVQAKIAAAMYLAAVTEPLDTPAAPPPEPPTRPAPNKGRAPATVTVSLRSLFVGYVLIFLIPFAWVYATASSTFIHVAAVPLAVIVLTVIAGLYATVEFIWLLLVSRFGRQATRMLTKARLTIVPTLRNGLNDGFPRN